MVKTFWVVRHAEREDNINRGWQRSKEKNPRNLASDNSPLSERGRKQADELGKRFAKIEIDHVFASPFDRTVETATRLIAGRNIPIKVEPGLAEFFADCHIDPRLQDWFQALYLCESQPGFQSPEVLKETYPLVDTSYKPVFSLPLPKESYGDDACTQRVRKTLEQLIERYPDSDNIVLVGHGASIGAVHEVLCNDWTYVGQATVSKFDCDTRNKNKFHLDYSSDASHLSDKKNLRPY